jgi:hypothetical protein
MPRIIPDERYWRRRAQKSRPELLAMGAIVDPLAGGRDPLARANGCGITNHGYNSTMPARLGPQNAKAILGIMVGYPIDEARQHFLG